MCQYSKLGAVTAFPYFLDHPYDDEIMLILEALQCKKIRHEEVSRILERVRRWKCRWCRIWHNVSGTQRSEDQWREAGAELSSPQQTQRRHQLRPSICQPPASSPDPGAGRGPARTTLHSIDFCFRFPQRQRVSGVQAPGSRLQARSARNRLSPARPRRHGRGAPASLDPHKATARLGPVRGHPSCNAACSLQHCSTAALQHAPHQHYFQRPASNIKHEAWASMTELSSVGTRRSILNYDALSLCLNIN